MYIGHFAELDVYRRSADLAARIHELSSGWPPEERYALTDQIRRASRSVGANLAEAWGKRRYEAHFLSKLSDADAENHEVEHWLLVAARHGCLSAAELPELLSEKRLVGGMLGSMIRDPHGFLLKNAP